MLKRLKRSLLMICMLLMPVLNMQPVYAAETLNIYTADEFIAFSNNVAKGNKYSNTIVRLYNDITLPGSFISVGNGDDYAFSGVFDGQSHSVTLNINTTKNYYVGLFAYVKNGTVKNVKVKGSITSTHSSSWVGAIASCTSKANIDKCINEAVINGGKYTGGIVGYDYSGTTRIQYCENRGEISSSSNAWVGGIVGYLNDGSVLNYCINNGKVTSSHSRSYVGGLIGESDTAEITNSCNSARVYGGQKAGQIYGTGDHKKVSNTYAIDETGNVNVFGNSSKGSYLKVSSSMFTSGEVTWILNGSTDKKAIFYQTLGSDQAPTIEDTHARVYRDASKNIFTNKKVSLPASDGQIVYLWNQYDVINLSESIEGGNTYSKATVKLMADIVIPEEVNFTSIGKEKVFSGTFEGNKHSITYTINSSSNTWFGLFGKIVDGTVQNVTVKGTINVNNSGAYVGAICAEAQHGIFKNCTSEVEIRGKANVMAGILGYDSKYKGSNKYDVPDSSISRCTNNGMIYAESTKYAAGILAYDDADSGVSITNCKNTITVRGNSYVGGISAYTDRVKVTTCTNSGMVIGGNANAGGITGAGKQVRIVDCKNSGEVDSEYAGGGIYGCDNFKSDLCEIQNCSNSARIIAYKYAGGIAGGLGNCDFFNCTNTGNIDGDDGYYAGGIVGCLEKGSIKGCENTSIVQCTDYAGGIAGWVLNASLTVNSCINRGQVDGVKSAGGIAGYSDEAYFSLCWNEGAVTCTKKLGGIIGIAEGGKVMGCANKGTLNNTTDATLVGDGYGKVNFGSGSNTGTTLASANATSVFWLSVGFIAIAAMIAVVAYTQKKSKKVEMGS